MQVATNSDRSESSGSSQSTSSAIYTVECNTIDSGISILNNYLSKKLNFAHCSAIIFSEQVAKIGIKDYINTFANNLEIRPTCHVIISSSTGLEALEIISNSHENFSARFYEFVVNSVDYTGYSVNAKLSDFFYLLNTKNSKNIATYANIKDGVLQNSGIAIFNKDKFLTDLSVLDSIAYSIITNKLKSCTITIPNPLNNTDLIDVSISPLKDTKIKISLLNNFPYIEIIPSLECAMLSTSYNINIESLKDTKMLENAITNYINNLLSSFLYKISHEYDVDICDFENSFSSDYLTYEDFQKINWNKVYKDSYFNFKSKVIINNSGLISTD